MGNISYEVIREMRDTYNDCSSRLEKMSKKKAKEESIEILKNMGVLYKNGKQKVNIVNGNYFE
ncbi:MAG: hypothetical protein K6E79_00115 [Pseudobutyrivibrio sp.]|nr:hypothetical protein [Pseudobutyrivibrio sp.]